MKSVCYNFKVFTVEFLVVPSLCVVELVFILCGGAGVRRGRVSVDGCGNIAAVLVVVRQRQVQEAGASGQVDVLHVLHLRSTHGTQLGGIEEETHLKYVCLRGETGKLHHFHKHIGLVISMCNFDRAAVRATQTSPQN